MTFASTCAARSAAKLCMLLPLALGCVHTGSGASTEGRRPVDASLQAEVASVATAEALARGWDTVHVGLVSFNESDGLWYVALERSPLMGTFNCVAVISSDGPVVRWVPGG